MDESFEIIEDDEEEVSESFDISGIWYSILLFLIYIFLNSELFIDKVLSNIDGTTDHKIITSKGVLIQAVLLVLIMICVDLGIKAGLP
jgi:hypothetical protein